MKASYEWLKELSGIDASPEEMAERFTRGGIEVERIEEHGAHLSNVVLAEVLSKRPHPTKDKLSLVTVRTGRDTREVVCGAPNVPEAGGRVALADVGAKLPSGMVIAEREVAGVRSAGMLASEAELGIGSESDGILVLDSHSGKVGAELSSALGLRDHVFELSLTPNRPDCLGHWGLARELCALFGQSFSLRAAMAPPRMLAIESSDAETQTRSVLEEGRAHPGETLSLIDPVPGVPATLPIRIEAPQRCSRYLGLIIQRVRVTPAPFWMRYRLHLLGQRSIDCLVDATNWVLLETGHPVHAFDLAKIGGRAIHVRTARQGETLTTLDREVRELSEDDLVIADAERPLAIAGVIGGLESGVSASTENIVLEVAYFDSRSVRRTSRRHGLHTEASHRFERGVDPLALAPVMRRAAVLLTTLGGGACSPLAFDCEARAISPRSISIRANKFEELLGAPVSEHEARSVLERLGCSVASNGESSWQVTAPTHRPDLTIAEDLVEEVARVRGYDLIPATLAPVHPRGESPDPTPRIVRSIRLAAVEAGLFEAVNLSFTSREQLERAKAPSAVLELANPLSEEARVMRTSLLPGLLINLLRAQRHQVARVTLFEVGRTFHPANGSPRPRERGELAILLAGPRGTWIGDETPFDFWDGKAVLERIASALGLRLEFRRGESPGEWLHPQRAAQVLVAGNLVGEIGEVHPDVVRAFDLVGRPMFASVSLEVLVESARAASLPHASSLPKFPKVMRDLAIIVPEATLVGDVEASVVRADPLVEGARVFDVYRGSSIATGCKSLALRIAYRDLNATLTDSRVEEAHLRVVSTLEKAFVGQLRA